MFDRTPVAVLRAGLACLAGLLLAAGAASAGDWPTWRHDARRSAASAEELPRELFLQWVRQYPALEPAWLDQPRLRFDVAYEPIVAGATLFFASPINDSVAALDAATGAEKWRFFAEGPVRFAPAAWQGRLYFVSDDGHLYCLDAAQGKLLWKFRGSPRSRMVLGNRRLVDLWVARGAPVVHEGRVYFAAGIWPFEGVFVYSLDATTGSIVWANDSSGAAYTLQPHYGQAFAGVAPQGYLAISGDKLLVPCGRSVPACFDLATGKLLYYHLAESQKTGGFLVAANRDSFATGGMLFDLEEGDAVTRVGPAPIVTDGVVYGSDESDVVAFDVGDRGRHQTTDSPSPFFRRWKIPKLWKLRARGKAHIKAGGRLFAGARNLVQAIAIPPPGGKPKVTWEARIAGTPAAMAAAHGRLFVATLEGHLYCFGATRTAATVPEATDDVLVPSNARWRYLDDGTDPGTAWRTAAFDDRRWALGPPEPVEEEEAAGAPTHSAERRRNRLASTCFRHTFRVSPGQQYAVLKLDIRADDGAVAYLNGVEVWRRRMPDAFGYWTPVADRAPEGTSETIDIAPSSLAVGTNVLAVQVVLAGYSSRAPTLQAELAARRAAPQAKPSPRGGREDEWARAAGDLLRQTGATDGYCLVLGAGTGRLAEELARRSRLHVVAIDPDARKVESVRRRLDAAGIYGTKAAALVADPMALSLPPCLASLVTSEDFGNGGMGSGQRFVERVFGCLRPYGGVACFPLSADEHSAFASWVFHAAIERAQVGRSGGFTLLTRAGALPGSGDWTHQNADAANTLVSRDSRVKLPLGILWFGGPSNEKVLPRHGHGPSEQVVGGRLFIEGPDGLRATDVYTGRVLWEAALPGLGEAYDSTDHQPGANAIGSNYASAHDGVYVAYGKTCLRLDPATGERLAEFTLPRLGGGRDLPPWGFITLWDDVLVAGSSPLAFDIDPEFTPDEFDGADDEEIEELTRWMGGLRGFIPRPKAKQEKPSEFIARNLNLLLANIALPAKLPKAPSSKARALESAIASHLKRRSRVTVADLELKRLNRLLLEEHCALLPRKRVLAGKPSVYSGTSSEWLVALNRYSGKLLWTRRARDGFLHNAIAIGRDKLFCLDRLPEGLVRSWRWRGREGAAKPRFRLLALDVRTGSVLWSTSENVVGTWLAYSQDHDVLLQAGRSSRDTLPEPSDRMIAYEGESGHVLWDKRQRHEGPCMLHGETIITQGAAFDLLTGEPKMRPHPLTGEPVPWTFTRNYGCGTAVASEHLLTFRSAAAGFFDLARDGGTGNFGGFRSGCTSNLIAANGVLNAPDYTRTCTCSYQNQASLALVHEPLVDMWTFQQTKRSDDPIRRVGVNLGAPGDRLADNGTLWLDYPSVGGPSPHVPIHVQPEKPAWFSHDSSWVLPISDFGFQISDFNPQSAIRNPQSAIPLPWVAASGATGLRSVTVALASKLTKWRREHPTALTRWLARGKRPKPLPQRYTVRLHLVEPGQAKPGDRVFDVSLQGQRVLEALDVAAEAGGPRRPLVKEFRGIAVRDDLEVTLSPLSDARLRDPVLCGIEIVAED